LAALKALKKITSPTEGECAAFALIFLNGEKMNTTLTTIDIKPVSELDAQETQEVASLLQRVFTGEEDNIVWSGAVWCVLVRLNGELVTHVGIIDRVISVAGSPLRVGGIGGVATAPEWRGRGFASLAMRAASTFMLEKLGIFHGLLVCGAQRVSFYQSLSWQVVEDSMYFDQPSGKMKCDAATMIQCLTAAPWPEGMIDLCGLPW
jgi:aminoglycoside 2'-N-acetyltransferase I